jgi:formylmethanofuran dehydrogenase subunit E
MGMDRVTDDLPHGHYVVPFSQAVKFHGHICPGLATGFYASHMAMRWLASEKSPDDETYAVLESCGCGADAVQAITGCTTGKGNLVVHDSGKQVYTFGIRGRAKAIRIALRPEYAADRLDPGLLQLSQKVSAGQGSADEIEELRNRIEAVCRAILESSGEIVFDVREVDAPEPPRQGMTATVTCEKCGEPVAVGRAKKAGNGYICPACGKTKV